MPRWRRSAARCLQGVTKIPALAGKVSSGGCLNAYNTLKLLITPAPASNAVPTIASLAASTSSVQAGASVSLVAQGVNAGGGTIAGVSFYRDSNGNGQWDPATR